MATKKKPEYSLLESIRDQGEKFNKKHPILDTRYWVYEYKPSGEDDLGGYVPAKSSYPVSPYFKTREEAEAWMEDYDPTPYTEFKVGVENLRRYIEDRWGV